MGSHSDTELQNRPRLEEAYFRLIAIAENLGTGAKLPPMTALREQLGMSLGTLSDAVRKLNDEGVLRSASGVGVYVAAKELQKKSLKLGILFRSSIEQEARDLYQQKVLSGIRAEAARHNWELFLLNPGAPIPSGHNLNHYCPAKDHEILSISCSVLFNGVSIGFRKRFNSGS